MVPVLIKRTAVTCYYHMIDKEGRVSALVLNPICPEPMTSIELAYDQHQMHYDCVFESDELFYKATTRGEVKLSS